jgi:hypothetical protein
MHILVKATLSADMHDNIARNGISVLMIMVVLLCELCDSAVDFQSAHAISTT